jgi:hypothetical protein
MGPVTQQQQRQQQHVTEPLKLPLWQHYACKAKRLYTRDFAAPVCPLSPFNSISCLRLALFPARSMISATAQKKSI